MRRVGLAVIAALALVASGCGVAESGGSGGGDAAGGGQTRTVKHALGTTKVPQDPKRVVVLDTGELDSVVSLGVDPVGTVEVEPGTGIPDYLRDEAGNPKIVGSIAEPNMEAIAQLNPDLILSNAVRHKQFYDELSGIAPTVMAESLGVTWKHNFMLDAEALGMKDQAEKMLSAYEQRASKLGEKIGEPGKVGVSVVRFIPGEIRLYQKGSYIGTILEDVGLGRPQSQDGKGLMKAVSPERIQGADGDVMFVTAYGPKKKTALASVSDSRLWRRLDAVQAGNVHYVPDSYWMVGIGIGAANEVLDDIEKFLVGQNLAAD